MPALVIGAIGTVIGWGVKKVTESTFTAVVVTGLFLAAMSILPFSVAIPSDIYNTLLKGEIGKLFGLVGWILPISDILRCTCLILLCRYSKLLWGVVRFIFSYIIKGVGSSQ